MRLQWQATEAWMLNFDIHQFRQSDRIPTLQQGDDVTKIK